MELYARLSEGLNNKGLVIPLQEFEDEKTLKNYLRKSPGGDWYTSLFFFPEEFKRQHETTGSVSGYKGPASANYLAWDFDSKEDLNLAKEDVRTLLNTLVKHDVNCKDHIEVYFSGNKGFHVFLRTTRSFNPEEMKWVCSSLAYGLKTYDHVIYNTTRLFRIANTKHQHSGLYKIQISPVLLKSPTCIEDIRKLSKEPQALEIKLPLENMEFIETILSSRAIKKSVVVSDDVAADVDGIRGLSDIDFSKKPKDVPKCIFALSKGIMQPGKGERNRIFLQLGNFYRNQGMDKELVHNVLKGVARLNNQLYPEAEEFSKGEIWNSVIKRVFPDDEKINVGGWGVLPDDPVFLKYCRAVPDNCSCPIHNQKLAKKSIVTIEDVAKDFNGFATNFHENIVTSGIDFVDKNMKIARGTTTLLVGAAGSGKTTLCLNMLEHAHKEDYSAMFFSMDMHKNLLYLKLAQRISKFTQAEIFKAFKNNDKAIINTINEKIKEHYGSTFFDFTGSLSLDDIGNKIRATEQETSKKVKIVIVDYASRLSGQYSDSNANEKFNALKSKDMADETNAAWIILNQVSRATGDGSSPIRTKRAAKGSGDWEESASNVITVWRPFMGLHEVFDKEAGVTYYDQFMRVFLAKNRMGPEVEDVLFWDGAGGHVRDFKPDEKERWETEEVQKEKAARNYKFANK